MTQATLPEHIQHIFLKKCKSAILMYYVGDRCQIWDNWAEKGKQGFVYLISASVSNDSQKGLRELRKLVKAGLLTEVEKSYSSQVCRFRLIDDALEQRLLTQAYEYWRSFGYSTDQIVARNH